MVLAEITAVEVVGGVVLPLVLGEPVSVNVTVEPLTEPKVE